MLFLRVCVEALDCRCDRRETLSFKSPDRWVVLMVTNISALSRLTESHALKHRSGSQHLQPESAETTEICSIVELSIHPTTRTLDTHTLPTPQHSRAYLPGSSSPYPFSFHLSLLSSAVSQTCWLCVFSLRSAVSQCKLSARCECVSVDSLRQLQEQKLSPFCKFVLLRRGGINSQCVRFPHVPRISALLY